MQESKLVPLHQAMADLAQLMQIIDGEGSVPEYLKENWETTRKDFTNAIARRICLLEYLPSMQKQAQEMADAWIAKKDQLEEVERKVKEHTMMLMDSDPDLPFTSPLGTFHICKNGTPSLEKQVDVKKTSVSNVISEKDRYKIPERFIQAKTYYTLVTDALIAELKNGAEFDWAKLNFGRHLRIGK